MAGGLAGRGQKKVNMKENAATVITKNLVESFLTNYVTCRLEIKELIAQMPFMFLLLFSALF